MGKHQPGVTCRRLLESGRSLRAPVGGIHWAGTATASYRNGSMDGAIRAGERAAGEALAGLGRSRSR